MNAVSLIGSPKTSTSKEEDWDTVHVAEIVFEACNNGNQSVKSSDVVRYVKENWVYKDTDTKQADDQLRRLLATLDPGGSNETIRFQDFVEKFTMWVESEQSRDARCSKLDTYETETEDNGTIGSSTTESLLSWDYPPTNGYEAVLLRKENQILKEQLTSAEVYNQELVVELEELHKLLKTVQSTKSDLDTELNEQNSEISSLRAELTEWKSYATLYKSNLEKLESKMKRGEKEETKSDSPSIDMDEYVLKETYDSLVATHKDKIVALEEQISFYKEQNDFYEAQAQGLAPRRRTMSSQEQSLRDELEAQEDGTEEEEVEEEAPPPTVLPEYFLTPDEMDGVMKEELTPEPLLSSFLSSPDDFGNLVTSIARQLGRVLKFLKPSHNLVPRAERQLFTDVLHQMAASKHLSEIKIAQLVELFRRLKADHRQLGDEHECLRSEYATLYADYEELRAEVVAVTRTNAQLRSEIVAVYEGSEMTPPSTPENSMQRRDEHTYRQEIDDLKKKLKGAEKANLTLTLAIEEQTKQRNALQDSLSELQNELNSSIGTISRLEYDNKTLTKDNEKLAETYTRQKGDLDDLRKEWVNEMDRCSTIESGYNSLNKTIVESLRGLLTTLNPSLSFPSFETSFSLPLEEWCEFLNKEFLEASRVAEEFRLNSAQFPLLPGRPSGVVPKKSSAVQTDFPVLESTSSPSDTNMKGNLARAACFESSRSTSEGLANGKPLASSSSSGAGASSASSSATTKAPKLGAGIVDQESTDIDISAEYQFTTDVATLSRRSVEGEFQAIMMSFENDTFTLQKRSSMHDRAQQKASQSFQTEVSKVKDILGQLQVDFLPDDKKAALAELAKTITLLPETMETLSGSAVNSGRCQQEEKHVRLFEVMVAHNLHTKRALAAALAASNQNPDLGLPKKDVDRAAVRKKTLAVAAAMRKDEEKQKQMQASESSSVFSSFAGVVKNLMVKTPAEPDLANRRATEMMQRMKTVETLGADKEALYKEGYRGGLSSGLHDTFDNIKKEQRACDESIDTLNKRATTLEREVAFYRKHSTHLFYGGAATPAATLRTIFCTVFINLFVLFLLLVTVPLPEHSGYSLGTGYISLQEFITSHFLTVPDRNRPII